MNVGIERMGGVAEGVGGGERRRNAGTMAGRIGGVVQGMGRIG